MKYNAQFSPWKICREQLKFTTMICSTIILDVLGSHTEREGNANLSTTYIHCRIVCTTLDRYSGYGSSKISSSIICHCLMHKHRNYYHYLPSLIFTTLNITIIIVNIDKIIDVT